MAIDKREFETMRQQFSALRSLLAMALNNADAQLAAMDNELMTWDDDPTPPDVVQPSALRFARHKYDNSTVTDVGAFQLYGLQRGWRPVGALLPGAEVAIYATMVRRPSDEEGLTQFLRPHLVPDSWCVHRADGSVVTRVRESGEEALVNFSHPQWLSMAVPTIIDAAKKAGAGIIYVDEIDAWWGYAWSSIADTGSVEFPNENTWRQGMVTFLTTLRIEARRSGLKVWVNLGADYDAKDSWQGNILSTIDMVNMEFYTGREGVGAKPTSSLDGWLSQNNFIAAVEKRGIPVHVHCSSLNQRVVDYAYRSWLLFRQPKAYGTFSASLNYGGEFRMPSSVITEAVHRLGEPTEEAKLSPVDNLFTRQHANGFVVVNPQLVAQGGIPAQSGSVRPR